MDEHKEINASGLRFPVGFPESLRSLALNSSEQHQSDSAKSRSFQYEPYFDHAGSVKVLEELANSEDPCIYLYAIYSLYASTMTDQLDLLYHASVAVDQLDRPLSTTDCRTTLQHGLEYMSRVSDEWIEPETGEEIGCQHFHMRFLPRELAQTEVEEGFSKEHHLQIALTGDVHAEYLAILEDVRRLLTDSSAVGRGALVCAVQMFVLNDSNRRVEHWKHWGLIGEGNLLALPFEEACAKSKELAMQRLDGYVYSPNLNSYILLEFNYSPWSSQVANETRRRQARENLEYRFITFTCWTVLLLLLAGLVFIVSKCSS